MLEASTCLWCFIGIQASGIDSIESQLVFSGDEQAFYPLLENRREGNSIILTGVTEFFCTLSYIQEFISPPIIDVPCLKISRP
jgi:hypothetical protein